MPNQTPDQRNDAVSAPGGQKPQDAAEPLPSAPAPHGTRASAAADRPRDVADAAPASLPHPVTGQEFRSPVPPGTGWPDDDADADTAVARDVDAVRALAADADLDEVTARSSVCRACSRLVEWRENVAATKRAAFAAQPYWGRPTPGWGDSAPGVLVVGLAPAANGGNRTGRVFTGDRSGDWLYAALHRAGLASRPAATHAGDGLRLHGVRIVAAVRCAPPDNKPTPAERDTCAGWLEREAALLLPSVRAIVALGSFAWAAAARTLVRCGVEVPRPRPKFGHGAEVELTGAPSGRLVLIGSYHPSQQNTFTGKLTERMLDDVMQRAKAAAR